MVSATLDDPSIKKGKTSTRPRRSAGFGILREEISRNTCTESNRRTAINTIEALSLLSKGYMPFEVRRKMNMDRKQFNGVEHRLSRLALKYQARKIEELVFLAEIRHNHIYKQALEAFEQSKKDAKGNARPGNPIFLTVANESLRDIRKLLGLDKNADFINNGNMAILNWDSLHNANVQSEIKALATVDPVEERIRELEKVAQEREYLLKETIASEEKEVLEDSSNRVIEISAENVISSQEAIIEEETIEPEPVKKVKLKIKQRVVIASTIDDMCAV